MCGEKSASCADTAARRGSPPHVRGKVTRGWKYNEAQGITPACAGKRSLLCKWCPPQRDHPRMCGEKMLCKRLGKHGLRITPACAGKRRLLLLPFCRTGDHPRMCGEKISVKHKRGSGLGSPPHVRGKVQHCAAPGSFGRITPACAGKRRRLRLRNRAAWDHPRMCGEKSKDFTTIPSIQGSPPHVRGKARLSGSDQPGVRITPACAGKSRRTTPGTG